MFVPGKPFQPSLMFVGKPGAYPSGAPQVLQSRLGYKGLPGKTLHLITEIRKLQP